MLKDPKKKEELDLEDPLVRVVYDTLIANAEPLKLFEENSDNEDKDQQQVAKILPDSDFVPFNPMQAEADKMRALQVYSDSKRKKNKKVHEEWNDGQPYEEGGKQKDFVGLPNEHDDKSGNVDGCDDNAGEVKSKVKSENEQEVEEGNEDDFHELPTSKSSKKMKKRAKWLENLKLKKLMKLQKQKKYELAKLEQEEQETGTPEIIEIRSTSLSPPPNKFRIAPKQPPAGRRNKRKNESRADHNEVICLDDDSNDNNGSRQRESDSPPRRKKRKEKEGKSQRGKEWKESPPNSEREPIAQKDIYAGFMQSGKVRAVSTFSNACLTKVKRKAAKINGNASTSGGDNNNSAVSTPPVMVAPHINPMFLPRGVVAPVGFRPPGMHPRFPRAPPPQRFLNQFRQVDGKSVTYSR